MTPAAIGGRSGGSSMRDCASSARSDCKVGSFSTSKAALFVERLAVDLGPVAEGAPDDVGSDADDRVAPAHGAALHRFQQAADGLPVAQLQGRRDRRLEVGDEPRPHHLG